MTKRVGSGARAATAGDARGGRRAGGDLSLLLLCSRGASLGALALTLVAIGRLLAPADSPADSVDLIPSLLLIVAAVHAALLGVVLWLFDDPNGDAWRSNAGDTRCAGEHEDETPSHGGADPDELTSPGLGAHGANERTRAA